MRYPITGAPPSTSLKPGDIDTLAELNALLTDATLIDTSGLSRLVVLTEAEYAALSPPVAGTVYLTTPNP
jgi:hypothetical protein